MSAMATAAAVLAWAADPADAKRAVPVGSLSSADALTSPSPAVRAGLQELARRTAARLGAGRPPLGDDGPMGLGAVLLAAAAGGRADQQASAALARAAPPLRLESRADVAACPAATAAPGWADAIARHGVASRFAGTGRPGTGNRDVTECLLEASPLTAILVRPPAERMRAKTTDELVATAVRLTGRPGGQRLLATLAAPVREAAVLGWRALLLARLAGEDKDAALSVYIAARLRHGAEWDALLDWAARAYGLGQGPDGAPQATLRYWMPLAVLDAEDPALLPSQPFLAGSRRAVDLARRFMTAETVTS